MARRRDPRSVERRDRNRLYPKLRLQTPAWTLAMSGDRINRHQAECDCNRTMVNRSAAVSAAPAVREEPGERQPRSAAPGRSRGGSKTIVPVFQPGNGVVTQSNEPPTSPGRFIPAEPGDTDAECELKAMDCIAKNAERDDVRDLFRIEVGECFLAMYQRHLWAWADFFGARDPTLGRSIAWMWVGCPADARPTVPDVYVFGHGLAIVRRPETVGRPGVET